MKGREVEGDENSEEYTGMRYILMFVMITEAPRFSFYN